MTKRLLLIKLLAAGTVFGGGDPADEVNPFTGTSNSRWMLFPGPKLPFGLVKLSPDNQTNVWNGGYEYTVGSISGFSHLHAMSLSGVSLMPVTGNLHPETESTASFPVRLTDRSARCGRRATVRAFARRTRKRRSATTACS